MADRNFVRVGHFDDGNFNPGDLRAQDVFATNGVSAEQHITDTANNPHNISVGMIGAAAVNHTHTPVEVGLGNVNNTADMDKPISNATNAALVAINTILENIGGAVDDLAYVRDVNFNNANGDLTFTRRDDTVFTVNLPISELISGITYDTASNSLIITQQDGTTMTVNVSALIPIITGSTGTHIQVIVTSNNELQAVLRAGSIQGDRLVNDIALPGTPTVATPPPNTATGNEVATMSNIVNAVGNAPQTVDAAFVTSVEEMQALNLRNGALILMRVGNA